MIKAKASAGGDGEWVSLAAGGSVEPWGPLGPPGSTECIQDRSSVPRDPKLKPPCMPNNRLRYQKCQVEFRPKVHPKS